MCGIIGTISLDNSIYKIKSSLEKLEYRGYDSSGIGYKENNELKIIKKTGKLKNLFQNLNNVNSNLIIAHTRWATHGEANEINAHPHISNNHKYLVVHNGIIENYLDIKNKYLSNYNFISDTDTEILPNLVDYYFNQGFTILESLNKIQKILKGNNAFLLLSKDEDNIYFLKNNAPLIISVKDNNNFISSDINATLEYTNKVIYLPELSYGYLNLKEIKIYDLNHNLYDYKIEIVNLKSDDVKKNNFKYYMLKEIYDIPKSLKDTINYYKNNKIKIPKDYFNDITNIKILGCGTSYHSGLIGKKLIEEYLNINTEVEISSEFNYNKNIYHKNTLYILISQSGETIDTILSSKLIKNNNLKSISITNVNNSTLTHYTDYSLYLKCGPEIAVASTKAYNTQILMFYILISYLLNDNNLLKDLNNIINKLDISSYDNQIKEKAKKYKKFNQIFFIGRNYDYIQSLESALKLKEISYIHSEAYPSGELKHGTLALINKKSLVICINTNDKLKEKTLLSLKEIEARKAKTLLISKDDNSFIQLPNIDYKLLPIISIIPSQLFSYYISIYKNLNPDKPRNLAKSVTVE